MTKRTAEYGRAPNVEEYVRSAIQGFVGDPPDTDSQWGYLSALLVVGKEGLGQRMDMSPFAEGQELWKNYELVEDAA